MRKRPRPVPNFFDQAMTEKCQDAFLMWLLAWAHCEHRETNEPLHNTAVYFLRAMFRLHGFDLPDTITDLWVGPRHPIDILVLVNDDFILAIEDKVDHVATQGQLGDYRDLVGELSWLELRGGGFISGSVSRKPVLIYLKTGDGVDQRSSIMEAGWKPFLRDALLGVMRYGERQGVEHDVFSDFYSHLESIDRLAQRRHWRRVNRKTRW
jgi:hypothetical protein